MYITAINIEKRSPFTIQLTIEIQIKSRRVDIPEDMQRFQKTLQFARSTVIHAYFVYRFYNVENDKKIHLKNGETLKVKRGCYTMKDIEKVSSGKVKYDSLTGKSVISSTISRFRPYMNKILGINNGNYIDTLLPKKNVFI